MDKIQGQHGRKILCDIETGSEVGDMISCLPRKGATLLVSLALARLSSEDTSLNARRLITGGSQSMLA